MAHYTESDGHRSVHLQAGCVRGEKVYDGASHITHTQRERDREREIERETYTYVYTHIHTHKERES